MAQEPSERLTAAEARAKAAECRGLAQHAIYPERRIMLEHIAETWERIVAAMATATKISGR